MNKSSIDFHSLPGSFMYWEGLSVCYCLANKRLQRIQQQQQQQTLTLIMTQTLV